MKSKIAALALVGCLGLLTGCVGLPSLVHVEHKHEQSNDIAKRLESIETRLSHLEQKPPAGQ